MEDMFDILGCFAAMMGYNPSIDGFPRVRFRNGITTESDLFLIKEDAFEGPIATKEQYENCECSFAHLTRDGRVMRFCKQIGTIDDLFIWYPLQLKDAS